MAVWLRRGRGVLRGWGHGTPRGHDATMAVALPATVASLPVQTPRGSGPHRDTQRFRDTQKFSGKPTEL